MSGWSCGLRKGGVYSWLDCGVPWEKAKDRQSEVSFSVWRASDSHFVTLIVFVVRRKLLKATLLSRLQVKRRQRLKWLRTGGRGSLKRTLLLVDVSSVGREVADAVCLSETRVRVRCGAVLFKKFLPGFSSFFVPS